MGKQIIQAKEVCYSMIFIPSNELWSVLHDLHGLVPFRTNGHNESDYGENLWPDQLTFNAKRFLYR